MEVVLESDSDGMARLSKQSQQDLETVLENNNCSEDEGIVEIAECADDNEFYEVEKKIDVRLNKQYHSEEYKVRFKGYGSEDDMWIPSSSFREPVQFQTISKRGRIQKHKTKDEGEVEIQQRKRPKQSNAITANTTKKEHDERIEKDVTPSNVSLPKKPTKRPLNDTVSKRRRFSDLNAKLSTGNLKMILCQTDYIKKECLELTRERRKCPPPRLAKEREEQEKVMVETLESLFSSCIWLKAIPVEVIRKNLSSVTLQLRKSDQFSLRNPRKDVNKGPRVKMWILFFTKGIRQLMLIVEILLSQQPTMTVVALELITEKGMEVHFKCVEAPFTSLGMRTFSALKSSVHR